MPAHRSGCSWSWWRRSWSSWPAPRRRRARDRRDDRWARTARRSVNATPASRIRRTATAGRPALRSQSRAAAASRSTAGIRSPGRTGRSAVQPWANRFSRLASGTGVTKTRARKRSANAARAGSVGRVLAAPTHTRIGLAATVAPRRNTRSLSRPSSVFRMALDPWNTSSRTEVAGDVAHRGRFGRARWSDHQQVLAGDRAQHDRLGHQLPVHQPGPGGGDRRADGQRVIDEFRVHPRSLGKGGFQSRRCTVKMWAGSDRGSSRTELC